jgi:hypothetical protein
MKTRYLHLTILMALPALAGVSNAQQQAGANGSEQTAVAYTERISESDLVQLRKQSQPFVSSSTDQAAAPEAAASFADASEFISFGGLTTFVPKGAVLHVPERLRGCMTQDAKGELVFWTDFLNRFPALVEPFEVSIREAAAATAIKPERLAAVARSERIIITVILGNPTSTNKCRDKNAAPKP